MFLLVILTYIFTTPMIIMPRNSMLYRAIFYGLSQHVTGSTHCYGHTLDVVISKGLNISATVKDVALSDHYCVFFEIWTSLDMKTRYICFQKRFINDSTATLFMSNMCSAPCWPSDSVDGLLESFISKTVSVMDDMAPVKVKTCQ